jgi:hypothetical protein
MNLVALIEEKNYIKKRSNSFNPSLKVMAKPKEDRPIEIKCPNCKQTREPDFNETTRRYLCSLCSEPVDIQVIIEKKKRGIK